MSKIDFCMPAEHDFVAAREIETEGNTEKAGHSGSSVRMRHPGSDREPQLFEVRCEPNLEAPSHAHGKDEIIVVTAGELRFGNRVCGPGASVFIPAYTAYGFTVGPEGATFLNFRPTTDNLYLSRDELVRMRQARELPD